MRNHPLSALGLVASLVTDRVAAEKDPSKPYIGLEHLPSGGSSVLGVAESGDSVSTNSVFRTGDMLFGKLRPRLRKSVRARFDGYCSTDILVLRANVGIHPPFAGFVLQSDVVFAEAIRTEEGTKMPRCSWGTLRKLKVFCPGQDQQQRIAEILSTVDEAIEQTEALIAKTQQIKAGLMHDLFTRGVTPDGKLRPPRDEAPQLYEESPLGWIPKEWGVVRCDDVFDVQLGKMMSPAASAGPNQRPYLRNQNAYWNRLDLSDVATMHFSGDDMLKYRLRSGDLLACEGRFIGRCAIWRDELEECYYQKALHRIRAIDDRATTDYMLFFMSLRFELDRGFVEQMTHESTIPHLPLEKLVALPVLLPPRREQDLMVDTLQGLTARDRIGREYLRKATHLKIALMHDLLTGRVQVTTAHDQRESGPA